MKTLVAVIGLLMVAEFALASDSYVGRWRPVNDVETYIQYSALGNENEHLRRDVTAYEAAMLAEVPCMRKVERLTANGYRVLSFRLTGKRKTFFVGNCDIEILR